MTTNSRIVFYDGHCGLCDGFVQFILPRDRKKKFVYAALQGETAQKLIPADAVKKNGAKPQSIIYFREGRRWDRSTAVLLILKDLGGVYSLFSFFLLVPAFLRNAVYALVARYRYKIFGHYETCLLPPAETRDRFLL